MIKPELKTGDGFSDLVNNYAETKRAFERAEERRLETLKEMEEAKEAFMKADQTLAEKMKLHGVANIRRYAHDGEAIFYGNTFCDWLFLEIRKVFTVDQVEEARK